MKYNNTFFIIASRAYFQQGAHQKVARSRILSRGHRAPAASRGAGHPYPRTSREGGLPPHFVRGLGFPLHPFVRGLMFYYGLDFHDLAPNFILNISAFIVVCEAFLRIRPHFGLWLKTFNIKPKVVGGQQAECGGAMVGKMPNVAWLEGSFVETVKGWQSGWFYITETRDTNRVASPNSDPASPCGSPPEKRRACPGVHRWSWTDSRSVSGT